MFGSIFKLQGVNLLHSLLCNSKKFLHEYINLKVNTFDEKLISYICLLIVYICAGIVKKIISLWIQSFVFQSCKPEIYVLKSPA